MKSRFKHLFFLLISVFCFAQNKTDIQKAIEFKKDFLDSANIFKPDTLRLETKIMIRERFSDVRLIITSSDKQSYDFYEYYYNDTNILEGTVFYNSNDKAIGISKKYYRNGELDYIVDNDKGEWTVSNNEDYPFYSIQNEIKIKADSLISSVYGEEFLKSNVVWSPSGSYVYDENKSASWTDKIDFSPTKFLFRYNVKFDSANTYHDLIEFELDNKGNFIPNQYEQIFGFEKIPEKLKGKFKLTNDYAMAIAKKNGLKELDSNKVFGVLKWECYRKPQFFNGNFRYYITAEIDTIENIVPNGRSSRVTKFEVYSFNPWSSEFIEKKKMKSVYSWEKNSGNQTGLIPDIE